MKKTPILTVIYFLLSTIVIFCVFINSNQNVYSSAENRMLTMSKDIKELNINNYSTQDFQNSIKSVVNDQFPLKDKINKLYIMTDKLRSDVISYVGRDLKPFLIPVGTTNRISGTDYYVADVLRKNEDNDLIINNRIWDYERIYDKYGDKYKMYIYKPAAIEETPILGIYDGEEYWEQFYSSLKNKYKVKRQGINTLDDYKKIHYATDHHWNHIGAYEGYKDIINMISDDFEDVSKPYEMINILKRDVEFYGSTSIHNEYCLGYDDFVTYDINYDKDYSIYVGGEPVEQLGEKEEALKKPNAYLYQIYFGTIEKPIKIINNNCDNDKTLLIFGDSFSHPINEDIAAHFKTTYIIDTRYINDGDYSTTTFSLDDFLANNDVDCILWLQYYESLYFDTACYLPIKVDE